MRLDLSNPYLFYWLLTFIDVAVNEDVLDNCFYDDKHQDFFLTISISGIQDNVSCTSNCLCNGTNAGYSTVNCQSCCCQRRVMNHEHLQTTTSVATDNKILGNCFYNDQSEDLFFTTSVIGIQRNISCTDICNCNETNTGYSTGNCPLCCCQKRLTCRVTNHDCKGFISWGAAVTALSVLILLFILRILYFIYQRNKKRNDLKIMEMNIELANREQDKKELEKELANKKCELDQIKFAQNNLPEEHANQDQNGG